MLSSLLNHRRLFQSMFILAIIAVSWTCLMPLEQPPIDINHGDKLLHMLAYLALGLLLERAAPERFVPWGALALLAYSGVIELVQQQTGYRTGSWADMLANGSGILLALVLRPLVLRMASPLSQRQHTS
ncbi:VanZ family protein [Neiella sp. HB171785]|uniref:VanZ family protein n=1 Tax=Neiella litorisoli TaxID=2771431 RepID=A0A8J6UDY1_9GAMM|nr:VanZ family protein [Neiella litorisoli]MBD1388814.1 VanZ family protein [Neiella litorisoli]